jgi:hypothetical protein
MPFSLGKPHILDIIGEVRPDNIIIVSPEFTDSIITKTYSTIKAAVDSVAALATSTNPYEIHIAPGVYNEDPFTLPSSVRLKGGTTAPSVIVIAKDANNDLITCDVVANFASAVEGMTFMGVTAATKCCIRQSGNYSTVFFGKNISFYGCSNGLINDNGGICIIIELLEIVSTAAQAVGTLITGTTSSKILISNYIIEAPTAVGFSVNPIKYCFNINNSRLDLVSGSAGVAYYDNTQRIVNLNNDAIFNSFSSKYRNANEAIHVNSELTTTATSVFVHGSTFEDCVSNVTSQLVTAPIRILSCTTDDEKVTLPSGGEDYFSAFWGEEDGNTDFYGPIRLGYIDNANKYLKINQGLSDALSSGVHSADKYVTLVSGLNVTVAAGHGIVHSSDDEQAWRVDWALTTPVAVTDDATTWIYVNGGTSLVATSATQPSDVEHIVLAKVLASSGAIDVIHAYNRPAAHAGHILSDYANSIHKILANTGLTISKGSTARKLDCEQGSYWAGDNLLSFSTASDLTFDSYYGTGNDNTKRSLAQTQLDITNYDSSGTLTGMGAGEYRCDTIFMTSDNKFFIKYGTTTNADPVTARAEARAIVWTKITDTAIPLAKIIVKQGTGVETEGTDIIDVRPFINYGTAAQAGGSPLSHGSLSDLDVDDHTQYLLADGTRALGGSLDFNSNNITNIGTINSITLETHADRHLSGGADPIAVADADNAGLMSGADKTFSDAMQAYAPTIVWHIAAIDNPHEVTNTQVGLGNVTNNPQITVDIRNQYLDAAQKTTLVDDDYFLIEDFETAPKYDKKALRAAIINQVIDHTLIKNIGTNAHSAIDSHIGSTSNPHTVTKAQVGLTNVTDDAQLKRAAGDTNSFTEKTTPIAADLVLIEDSAATNAKKKVQLGNIPGTTAWEDMQYAEDETVTATTSTTYVDSASPTGNRKLRLTFTPPVAGDYIIDIMVLVTSTATNRYPSVRCQLDDTTDILPEITRSIVNAGEYVDIKGFKKVTLTATAHNIDIDFRLNANAGNISAKSARITARRVS